jgi:hypothetical protein
MSSSSDVKIPKNCESCERKYTVKERTNYHFQKKAKLLIVFSVIAPTIFLLIMMEYSDRDPLRDAFKSSFLSMVGTCIAYNMRRALILRCPKCKTTQTLLFKVKNKHKLFEKNDEWL